jgi:hypothetical protein
LPTQIVQLPGTPYSIIFNSPELQVGEPRDTASLSVAIASWLSANFGMPTMRRLPRVEYVPASQIEGRQSVQLLPTDTIMETPAAYERRTHTIYLPNGWNGSTPAELSVFVREMVHHLQNEANLEYLCTPSGAKLALAVQYRWLAMFDAQVQHMDFAGTSILASSPRCILRQSSAND